MDIAVESDIYEQYIDETNNYIDLIPPSNKFIYGLRCPCGVRKEHVFDNRTKFTSHIKSKRHQQWLNGLNVNKMNYFSECEKLKETVNTQKIIIGQLEKQCSQLEHKCSTQNLTIVNLANQFTMKQLNSNSCNHMNNTNNNNNNNEPKTIEGSVSNNLIDLIDF